MTPDQKAKLDSIGWCSLTNRESLYHTWYMARDVLVRGIPGDMAECGVFAGAQVAAMWYAGNELQQPRTLHLFDSFEGIPVAGPRDYDDIANLTGRGDGLVSSGKSVCSADQVKHYMSIQGVDPALCVYHKGWFQHTLPGIDIAPLSLLRLDGDLYESTKVCLDHLYDKVTPGGIVIIDDWIVQGAREATEEFIAARGIKSPITAEPFGVAWWVK